MAKVSYERDENGNKVELRSHWLVAYYQPTDHKHYAPLSFRWMGSAMDSEVQQERHTKFVEEDR